MNAVRACAVTLALTGIAFAVVWLRAEQTRVAASTLRLESRWIEQRRVLWALQTGVARLRTPHRLRSGVDRFETGLVPPEPAPARSEPPPALDHSAG